MTKYGDLKGTVTMVDLQKGQTGLGLSLAGNRDRNKMSVFVCGLHPQGSAFKDGRIQVGDEILEVRKRGGRQFHHIPLVFLLLFFLMFLLFFLLFFFFPVLVLETHVLLNSIIICLVKKDEIPMSLIISLLVHVHPTLHSPVTS